MSRDESGRLLSKVAKFVRNPLKDRAAPDDIRASVGPADGHDREILKELIERRQRNDLIRHREFDMLRKLRLAEAENEVDVVSSPSPLSLSASGLSERQTLTREKIDAFEDQMSRQWDASSAPSTRGQAENETMSARLFNAYADTLPGLAPLLSVDKSTRLPEVAASFSLCGNGWTCPLHLTRESVGELTKVLGAAGPVWELNWRALISIDVNAVTPLKVLFVHWGGIAVHLRFAGKDVLLGVLAAATPTNNRNTAVVWWELRMSVLRAMRDPDSFEWVALHYCLTYEVSPSLWEEPHCLYVSIDKPQDWPEVL